MSNFDLTSYQALSFDIYATLIDWEAGIFTQLSQLIDKIPQDHELRKRSQADTRAYLIKQYSLSEHELEAKYPDEKYSTILSLVYERLAADLKASVTKAEADTFGNAIGQWPAFPDTVAAMRTLGKYYKLVALSSVDKESFQNTLSGSLKGVDFDGIYVAEDIGSYKPDPRNFEYLVDHIREDFGIEKDGICHTAQNLPYDHAPAAAMGFRPSVWISRGGGDMGGGDLEAVKDKVNLGATYETLEEMAEAVENAFRQKSSSA